MDFGQEHNTCVMGWEIRIVCSDSLSQHVSNNFTNEQNRKYFLSASVKPNIAFMKYTSIYVMLSISRITGNLE